MNKAIPKNLSAPFKIFLKIEELLGWDLDDEVLHQLREARRERKSVRKDAYLNLNSI